MQKLTDKHFLSSLPKGPAFQDDVRVRTLAKVWSEAVNISNEFMRDVVIPELSYLSDEWNPQDTLESWEKLFGVDILLGNTQYTNELRNIILRLLIGLMKVRPYPISLKNINRELEKYPQLGLRVDTQKTFTFGESAFGDGTGFGKSSGTVVLKVDAEQKYAKFYVILLRLLERLLPIWANITSEFVFSPQTEVPNFAQWMILHDSNHRFYYCKGFNSITPDGSYQMGTSLNGIEGNYIIVNDKLAFPMDYYRTLIKQGWMLIGFFVRNINAQAIRLRMNFNSSAFGRSEILWTWTAVSVEQWTFCSVRIFMPIDILVGDIVNLEFFCEAGRAFEIDQIRMYAKQDELGYDINLTQEILYQDYSSVETNNAVAIYLNGFNEELAKHRGGWDAALMQRGLEEYYKFGLSSEDNPKSFDFGRAEFGFSTFGTSIIISKTDSMAEYSFAADAAVEIMQRYTQVIYIK